MDTLLTSAFATSTGYARLRIEGIGSGIAGVRVSRPRGPVEGSFLVSIVGARGLPAPPVDCVVETSSDGISWARTHDVVREDRG